MEKAEHILTYEHCGLQVPYGVRICDFPRRSYVPLGVLL